MCKCWGNRGRGLERKLRKKRRIRNIGRNRQEEGNVLK